MDVFSKVQQLLAERVGCDPATITPATTEADLGLDSLDRLEVLMDLEDAFDRSIRDEDAQAWKTVQDVVTSLQEPA